MKKKSYSLLILILLVFISANLFSHDKKELIYFLNDKPIDFNKVYLNPKRVDSLHVDKGKASVYTKDRVFTYHSLSDVLERYTDGVGKADSILFRIDKNIVKDTTSIKIDDTYFIYVDVESLKEVKYLTGQFRNLKIVNIDLVSEKRKPQIRIRGNKELLHSFNDDYLLKVFEGEFDEPGVESGYVNLAGDTVVPVGKYHYCYTDTLRIFAIVLKKEGGFAAIDRNDSELFEVFGYDNGPDHIVEGLFRIIKNGNIGYANKEGEIVIKPQFDCAFPFKNGKAKVSYDCSTVPEGEYSSWESESWFYINKTGKKIN